MEMMEYEDIVKRSVLTPADHECHERFFLAREKAVPIAIDAALRFVPRIAYDAEPIPTVFEGRWADALSAVRVELTKKYGDDIGDLIRLAARCFEYEKWRVPTTFSFLIPAEFAGKSGIPSFAPDEYAHSEGWCNVACAAVSDTAKPLQLLQHLPFAEFPSSADLLRALAVIWIFDAERLWEADRRGAMDTLSEIADALNAATQFVISDEEGAYQAEHHKATDPVRALARKAAAARHVENRSIAESIMTWFRENFDKYPSLDSAAEAVTKIEPVSFRTARKHIGTAAKQMRSARRE